MATVRRDPSRMRSTCITMSIAEAICSRIARIGRSNPAIITMFSMRRIASRGVFAWTVDKRAVVASVHRLQHVEGLLAAHLTDDDAVRPHAQRVLQQVALRDRLPAVRAVIRARLQPHHVRLAQRQLGRVFDRDDALVGGNPR